MLYPEINKLRDAAGSRYFLVSMAAKRARDLIDGSPKLDENITTNIPVSIAAEEISQGLFTYTMLQEEYEEEEYIYEEAEYIEEEEAEAEEIEAETEETL
ncbi:MAG: DNA-directed RNA polymerase subunit omega [Firmicutes bacterium]|nr:DNA-directed RNA polymerase subunit omega [Clostridiales bacterium]MBQ4339966.1 DNA-directed RNA polymerase subunit omega [Bacillota bacterium]